MSQKNIPYEKSFASHPKSKYWHPIKNGKIMPRMCFKSNSRKCWFKCDKCPHDFKKSTNEISSGSWCPYCYSRKWILCNEYLNNNNCDYCYKKSFANNPKSKFWHQIKNGKITPRFIKNNKDDKKKYNFKCNNCNHVFQSTIYNINNGRWCPYCYFPCQKLCLDDKCLHCFNNSFASHPKSKFFHSTKNREIPRNIIKNSSHKYIFQCNNCNHDFISRIARVTNKKRPTWCPYCSEPPKKLCDNKCDLCYNRSFASNLKSKLWHPNKNGNLTPRKCFKTSSKIIYFKCDICNHSYKSSLDNVTRHNTNCSYCTNKLICKNNKCEFCFKKSFASSQKAKYWHPFLNGIENKKNDIPRYYFKSCNKKKWFKCGKCEHSFKISLNGIENTKNGCPFCSHRRICKNYNCDSCFKKSFASSQKANFWHPNKNGEITPRMMAKFSSKKFWFKCNKCHHDFNSRLAGISRNRWCPHCVNKTETKLFEYLRNNKEELNIKSIKKSYRPKWANLRKTHNTFYEYDFYIILNNEIKCIFELDGGQHYKQVSNWNTPLHNQIRDKIKEMLASRQSISLLRLNQEDVLNDKKQWELDIKTFIRYIRYISGNIHLIKDCSGSNRYEFNLEQHFNELKERFG